MKKLQAVQEPLRAQEAAVTFTNNGDADALRSADETWKTLDAHLI
jgi:hypothetical protein